jgi:hypothetical protein
MPNGNCALCPKSDVKLQDSHIIPKCFYRRLRNPAAANPNPLHIKPRYMLQTSKQITQYLLCKDCEQMFANGCEAYVAKHVAYQANGDCQLYKSLGYASTVRSDAQPSQQHVFDCSSLHVQYVIDFAISIFWRSAVATGKTAFKLPAPITELLRSYLLNHGGELDQIPVTLTVLDQPRGLTKNAFHRVFNFPGTRQNNGYRLHGFLLCGLYFTMTEGVAIPQAYYDCSLVHAKPPNLLFSVASKMSVLNNIADVARAT